MVDVLGRRVAVVHDGPLPGGRLEVGGLAPGRYLVRVRVGLETAVRPLTVVR